MGTPHSQMELIDFAPNSNYSPAYRISEWEVHKPKNLDYYQGRRFTQILKELYPNMYKRGWLYGWYEINT